MAILMKNVLFAAILTAVNFSCITSAVRPARARFDARTIATVLASGAVAALTRTPAAKNYLGYVGCDQQEATLCAGALCAVNGASAAGAQMFDKPARYLPLVIALGKAATSYPVKWLIHNVPLGIGEAIVSKDTLNRRATPGESAATMASILIFATLYNPIKKAIKEQLRKRGWMNPKKTPCKEA